MLRITLLIVSGLLSMQATASLVYLNGDEVLDGNSGYVWLNSDRTIGLGFDNVYTQNGWRVSEQGFYLGDYSTFNAANAQGFVVSTFGYEFDAIRPYNQAIFDLIDFLGGDNLGFQDGGISVTGWSWGSGEYDGLRAIHPEVILYQEVGPYGQPSIGWRLDLDGGSSEDQWSYTGGRVFLYRDATPEEMALVPIPAMLLLPSALAALLLVKRRINHLESQSRKGALHGQEAIV